MRHRREAFVILALGAAILAGSASRPQRRRTASPDTVAAAAREPAGPAIAKHGCVNPPQDVTGPEGAVCEFLEAIRTGDDRKTESMFVSAARQRIKELEIPVTPRGTDTARFEIGQAEYLSEEGARVACKWTDLDSEGQRRTDKMTWMVRKEGEGWRIGGLAATVFDGEPPLLLDFENPKEVVDKLERLRQELVKARAKEADQAQRPEDSASPIQR